MSQPTLSKSALVVAVRVALLGSLAGWPLLGWAQTATDSNNQTAASTATSDDDNALEEVVVFARAEQQIGKADAASEGAVGEADLSVRPMLRVADLLEAVPGLIAAQHSGSGKANQYFLRGFQLDHGTDFTTYVDDMPWNLRTHGHGQGYLDVNGLIPETVERINYRKGTYRADAGDFSMAGSGYITTINELTRPFVAVEAGNYGHGRIAAGGTTDLGQGMLTTIGEYRTYDGPWQLKENLQHEALWSKYTQPTSFGTWDITLSGYYASWHPSEQIPESAIGTSECANEYCDLDPTAFGVTNRWIVTSNWLADGWRATAYLQYYDWHMLSNATYDVDGQINQFDRRWTAGGRYERTLVDSDALDLKVGTELRDDHIEKVGLDSTLDGNFVSNIANNHVDESSLALYSEATWRPVEKLRLMAGMRGDLYNFDVGKNAGAGTDTTAGDKSDHVFSPKLGAAYELTDHVELYGNWGQGFHSNDARGVVKQDDPVPGLVQGTGYEGGARYEVGTFNVSVAYWWLNLSSELIFVGDDNTVEPKGGSERHGYEVVAFWRPLEWLGIDGVYTGSHARYTDPETAGGKYVEGGVESSGELGVSAVHGGWELSARLRYLGPYPLLADNSQRAGEETMLNLRLARTFKSVTLYGELLNALGRDGKDIVYWYETNVPGLGLSEGRVSRAEEPRSLRLGVRYEF